MISQASPGLNREAKEGAEMRRVVVNEFLRLEGVTDGMVTSTGAILATYTPVEA